jgi:hypothetical protein
MEESLEIACGSGVLNEGIMDYYEILGRQQHTKRKVVRVARCFQRLLYSFIRPFTVGLPDYFSTTLALYLPTHVSESSHGATEQLAFKRLELQQARF